MAILLALFLGFNKRRQELRSSQKNTALCKVVLGNYNIRIIDQVILVITSALVVLYFLLPVLRTMPFN